MMTKTLTFAHYAICVSILSFFSGCVSNDLPGKQCENSDLAVEAVGTNPANCASFGSVQFTGIDGSGSYEYALDYGDFGPNSTINNVMAGTHLAWVRDSKGCVAQVEFTLINPSSNLAIDDVELEVSGCGTSNGSIAVTASGEVSISYSIDNIDFSNTTGVFNNLEAGWYTAYASNGDCVTTANNVRVTSGISFDDDIFPILEANCIKSGCHNGDNGASRNWNNFDNVKAKALKIKELTGSKAMPLDIAPQGLPDDEIAKIACWVDDGALDN